MAATQEDMMIHQVLDNQDAEWDAWPTQDIPENVQDLNP
jgi:hypothetical protein